MAEIPPPTRADKPAARPQTAKQIAAATTVTTTWPSTTLAASRLAWGNSRVTTTLLLQVDNSSNKTTGPRRPRAYSAMFENCLAKQRLTCALARGANYIRRPQHLQQKWPNFPGVFAVSGGQGTNPEPGNAQVIVCGA